MLWTIGKRVVYVLGASILVVVAVMAVWSRENAVEYADVGSCVSASVVGVGASGRQAECSDPDAHYVVATKPDRRSECPAPGYASYILDETKGKRIYMCLAPNLSEGRCYADVGAASSPIDEVVCPEPFPGGGPEEPPTVDVRSGEPLRVVQRLDETADAAVCSEGTTALVYPQPELTYCVHDAPEVPLLPVA
ncbi:hypothetical protein G4H71_15560 [Rhodococcus triatomae]|uniref:Uncharacterized protein n=1 Tax=Rhodococcus triatomae TaxID=300028 RepID=A0A1G8J3Y3_9NOCA|nr:hypothetical protein [Rhodococcus triatomae]QNG19820.1 hypothetical protein G4H72_14810 [Rhodococcus triatomae]QNG24264.1 hypothetical protein G4H71_15560 [Rhodococcus triatomae]SDI25959.1 hypothetical protein SAMN05444695_10660 [Rhodococcus triatomae]